MITPEVRAEVDTLSRHDLRLEVEKGRRSRFQGDKYAYAKTRLAQLDEQEASQKAEKDRAPVIEANKLARVQIVVMVVIAVLSFVAGRCSV
jgi:hypothetical protein